MKISVSSCFPASTSTVYENLQFLSTLQYITYPLALFSLIDDTDVKWQKDKIFSFHLKIFGFLDFGIHTINFIDLSESPLFISTEESNKYVTVWNHQIIVKSLADNKSLYCDKVEIKAGWKTPFVLLFAYFFYSYRQKRWLKLLNCDSTVQD